MSLADRGPLRPLLPAVVPGAARREGEPGMGWIGQLAARRRALGVGALVLMACLGAAVAHARPEGITGYSGKQGESCDDRCHFGGVPPVVHLEGPAEVPAGAVATFRFVVESQSTKQMLAGLNVAVSGGTLGEIPDQGARIEFGELAHAFPKVGETGTAAWDFTWRAPAEPGQQMLFGAGLSANGNSTTNGDESATTTLPVTVIAAPRAGDANCDGELTAADVAALVRAAVDGDAGTCGRADANCDTTVNADDLPTLVVQLFDDGASAPCT